MDPPEAATEEAPRLPAWTTRDGALAMAVMVLAAGLRLLYLADPGEYVFDETYYAKDACWYVEGAEDPCEVDHETTMVHPPLGKWLIAVGIKVFGFESFGWRISAVIAGAVTVLILYVLARRLFRSSLAATLSAGLLAIDPLHFVQSRIAMLDVFVPLFGLAAVLCVVIARDRRAAGGRVLWWHIASAALGGLALASKWAGGLYILLCAGLAVAWEFGLRRRAGTLRALPLATGTTLALFVVVPAIAYSATYVGRLPGPDDACPGRKGAFPVRVIAQQGCMAEFHALKLNDSHHSYESPPWSWLLLKRPVAYYFCKAQECDPPAPAGTYSEIFATGNPFVWWTSLLALAYAGVMWLRRREVGRPEGLLVAGFLAMYAPWLLADALSERDAVFMFYVLPAIPFMCLALAYMTTRIGRSWEAKLAVALFSLGAVAMFAFYHPLLTKRAVPKDDWDRRIWVFDDCDKPEAPEGLDEEEAEDLPPTGWCWI